MPESNEQKQAKQDAMDAKIRARNAKEEAEALARSKKHFENEGKTVTPK